MEIKTGYISVKNRRIFYRYTGEGTPVILLHGSHRSSFLWTRNIPELGKSFAVYAPDRPGYGESEPIGWTDPLPDMVDFANCFLQALGYTKAHWIGESRGGGVAIQLARQFPKAVDKLVLVSSIGLPPNELPKPLEIGSRSKWEWFVERSFDNPSIITDELREIVLANLDRAAIYEERRLASVPPEYNQKGLLEDITHITCPTLLIWGRQDPVFPVECVERFRQLIPNLVNVAIIDHARHLVHYEHPDTFNRIVLDFLTK